MGSIIQINKKFYEIEEVFADKQVVDSVIKDLQMLRNIVFKILKTQNNLIEKIKLFEEQTFNNFLFLRIRNGKLLKQARVNKANHFLLEDKVHRLEDKVNRLDETFKTDLTTNDLCVACSRKVLESIKRIKVRDT